VALSHSATFSVAVLARVVLGLSSVQMLNKPREGMPTVTVPRDARKKHCIQIIAATAEPGRDQKLLGAVVRSHRCLADLTNRRYSGGNP